MGTYNTPMAQYSKKVDAVQFLVSDEQKAAFEKGESISYEGYPIKYDASFAKGEEAHKHDFYAHVIVNSEHKRVNHSDYIIYSNGTPVDVVSEADFKDSHSEV